MNNSDFYGVFFFHGYDLFCVAILFHPPYSFANVRGLLLRIGGFWFFWGGGLSPNPKPQVPKGGPKPCWMEKGLKTRLPSQNKVISIEKTP